MGGDDPFLLESPLVYTVGSIRLSHDPESVDTVNVEN